MNAREYSMVLEHMLGEESAREHGGYQGLATRLSRDLDKNISAEAVKNYLKRKEKGLKQSGKMRDIKKRAAKARKPGAYLYGGGGAIYNILKGHFGEGKEYDLEEVFEEVRSKHPGLKQTEKKKLSRWPRAISRYNLNKARLKSSKKESEEIALYEKERKRKGQAPIWR